MGKKTKTAFKITAALLLLGILLAAAPLGAAQETNTLTFTIINPYAGINWDTIGRYRAALHVHTERSDGGPFGDTVLHHYNLGFDILAITDHNVTHGGPWDDGGPGALSTHQAAAIMAGTYEGPFPAVGSFGPALARDPNQGGMIYLPFTNEQSYPNDINTFWADFNNEAGWTNEQIFEAAQAAGGIATINHPGRYTGGAYGGARGLAASNSPQVIARYMDWLDRFPILGMEIFNRMDNESRSDRLLWDNLLQERMPYGLPVWGFATDDSHGLYEIGFNWNVMLLESLTAENTRTAMEEGAFYAVTRVNRGQGPADTAINAVLPDGRPTPIMGTPATAFILQQETPGIARIEVIGSTIVIIGVAHSYNVIEWVADGVIIHTGSALDVAAHAEAISSNYVRAQLVGTYGMALTQPFGIFVSEAQAEEEPPEYYPIELYPPEQPEADPEEIPAPELPLPTTITLVNGGNYPVTVPVEWNLTEEIAVTSVALNIAPLRITPIRERLQRSSGISPGMVHIQDASGQWSGVWVTAPGGWIFEGYVGEWVPATGFQHVQWAQTAPLAPFDQVQETHRAFMFGDGAGNFRPTDGMTRAEVATLLARTLIDGFQAGAYPPGMAAFTAFSDVSAGDWFYFYLAWAYDAGLIQGHGSGIFAPESHITREQFAAALARTGELHIEGGTAFQDDAHISHWARDYVYTVQGRHWMIGDGENNFNPRQGILRAEGATGINRILGRPASNANLANIDIENPEKIQTFPDVSEDDWFFASILSAANHYRLTRDSEGTITKRLTP